MKGIRFEARPLEGISERIPQQPIEATEIINFTLHKQTFGWDNRIGYERFDPVETHLWRPFETLGRIDSLFIWGRHQGAQEWVLFESKGSLYYLDEMSGDTITPLVLQTIESSRTIPASSEPVTSYAPFGRFLCVVNGYDKPLKYAAWPVWVNVSGVNVSVPKYQLGWTESPAAPVTWGIDLTPSTIAGGQVVGIWAGSSSEEIGLGSLTAGTTNLYRYKVTFVNNAGSESPISSGSNAVTWDTPAGGVGADSRFITFVEIPKGPPGTTARRVYRTVNLGTYDSGLSENYFFVMEVNNNIDPYIYDHVGDDQLGSLAPSAASSIIFPTAGTRFCATFKNCLFLDGGASDGTSVYWSNPGQPDTYAALDFFDVGARQSGEVTGFHAYYNMLLVFRERGIDFVRGVYGTFDLQPLIDGVGTKAKDTITTIPDLGVVFLASDGVYLIAGNVDGGGSMEVKKLSNSIIKTIDRMNTDVLARATATYSHKWREWHCYFAADGSDRPNLGIVLHVDRLAWSVREDFPVAVIDSNYNGDLIFGHNEGDNGAGDPDPSGLFVISHRRTCGQVYDADGGGQQIPAAVDTTPCSSKYRSAWIEFGDAEAKKRVHYVYLAVLTQGDNAIGLTYFKDYAYAGVAAPGMLMQRPDHLSQKVFGIVETDADVWEEGLVTQIRYPIDQGSCAQFQFEVETTNDFVLVGYAIEYTEPTGMKVITGKRS